MRIKYFLLSFFVFLIGSTFSYSAEHTDTIFGGLVNKNQSYRGHFSTVNGQLVFENEPYEKLLTTSIKMVNENNEFKFSGFSFIYKSPEDAKKTIDKLKKELSSNDEFIFAMALRSRGQPNKFLVGIFERTTGIKAGLFTAVKFHIKGKYNNNTIEYKGLGELDID